MPSRRSHGVLGRDWIKDGGGVLAADSPVVAFEMLELFREADLAPLVDGYLGEPALVSVHKTTLRRAAPSVPGAWHQDGSFMGPVHSLNLWLSLSRCGDVAPGLDIVPRRLDHLVARQTEEAMLEIQVSQAKAEEAAGDTPIVRPDLRARRRPVLRRAVPPPDGVGPLDAASALRDRELVLRRARPSPPTTRPSRPGDAQPP